MAENENKKTIMVVEDEELLLQAIAKKIELSGIDAISCSSGQQALDYLQNLPKIPDAIWLDYYLKDMNGLEFVAQVKKNPDWQNIPIVVVSNSASPEKVHNMIALGVHKYLLKAKFRLDDILKEILAVTNEEIKKDA